MKRVNVVIVGAGAAGGIVAKELSTAGLSVVLLERGKWYTPNDCRKDDLRNQRTTVLGNAFGPEDEGNPRVVVDRDGEPQILLPSEGDARSAADCPMQPTATAAQSHSRSERQPAPAAAAPAHRCAP